MMHIFNASLRRTIIALIAFIGMVLPSHMQANDYLEESKHYMAYSAGVDHIHFKIPVWVYGAVNNYYLDGESRIYYSKDGKDYAIAYFKSDRYDENDEKSDKGTAYMRLCEGMGTATVTSMADGAPYHVTGNAQWTPQLMVVQREHDGYKHVTFLEFDWYPPATMYGKGQIEIKLHVDIYKSYSGGSYYHYDWSFGRFDPGNTLTTPQLFTPYLYALNENGVTGYGNAGIPYAVHYEPKSYTVSLAPTAVIPLTNSERSGTLFVQTSDTTISQVTAQFKVVYNAAGDSTVLRSTAVDIPPYHRIHDFRATEETDQTGTYTGRNKLEWVIKNPNIKDLVDGDYFEIQRALKSDYSDAQTVSMIPMSRNDNGTTYTYSWSDDSRDSWTGNALVKNDTVEDKIGASVQKYLLKTSTGTPLCQVDVDFSTDMIIQPAVPVYYRIRRASSAIWGWEGHEFAQKQTLHKHNFLAPLSATQEQYSLDADYRNNHKVHFRIKLENSKVTQFQVPAKEAFNLSYSNVTLPEAGEQKISLIVNNIFDETVISVTKIDNGEAQIPEDKPGIGSKLYSIEAGSRVTVKFPSYKVGSAVYKWQTESYEVMNSSVITLSKEEGPWHVSGFCAISTEGPSRELVQEAINRVYEHLRDSLYNQVAINIAAAGSQLGRCMWDQTARLLLVRTAVETGQSVEFIIPNEQIVRQADGSWIASYTDVATSACTHYTYSVRIDQTSSDLRLFDPDEQLRPIALTGPELYYDEGATITELQATRGRTEDYLKQGVLLNWSASSANVDAFRVLRIEKGSDRVPDTLYTGEDNSYFDRTAVPDVHYDYTVTAIYQCSSRQTVNSATTEGWRTPYGEIQGTVMMSDNSGISGVTVSLQKGGEVIRTITTKADGAFRFDSLLYDLNSKTGTEYVVVPTAAYGQFGYNYTSTPSATVSLTQTNPRATDLVFINTTSVRMTGRVLFKGSTIPLSGAMFLLNGDTLRRGNAPLTTGIDGSFEIVLTQGQPYRLQVFKDGHSFEGDGILRVKDGEEEFALDKALDGVRFYDTTKVRLVGRVAGGNDQRDLPEGFGLGKNNLGDDLQLVLQLEGDNTAQIVHDPKDLTRDTLHQHIGKTNTYFEKKRIIIRPDIATGEYAVDLFPAKYKVVQATAKGYATLFASGQGAETFDLTNAPKDTFEAVYFFDKDSVLVEGRRDGKVVSEESYIAHARGVLQDGQTVRYNAVYDRIYHSPVKIHMTQLIYGLERDGIGEPTMQASTMQNDGDTVELYTSFSLPNGTKEVHYLLGYPVFYNKRNYQFVASAYEDYFYNNDAQAGSLDRVPLRGGKVQIHNGLQGTGPAVSYTLDGRGKSSIVLPVDNLDVTFTGAMALRTVTAALEYEKNIVETEVFRGYIVGDKVQENTLHSTPFGITLFDVARNPGGTGSSSWIESGTTYNLSFKESYKYEAGLNMSLRFGVSVSTDIGIITNAPGNYTGSTYETSRMFQIPIPLTHKQDWGYVYDYSFTTSERISTSSTGSVYNFGGLVDASAGVGYGVGGMADVFVGVTTSMLSGKAKTVAIISDSVYQVKQPAIQAGTIRVITSGVDAAGKRFHLVTADKVVMGTSFKNTFVYSQYYILYTIMPRLAMERQSLLSYFPDQETAQAACNRLGKPVYWVMDTTAVSLQDTLQHDYYKMLTPANSQEHFPDEVRALDNMLYQWTNILVENERVKVFARMAGRKEGTYSVSFGNSYTRTDSYSALLSESGIATGNRFAMDAASTASSIVSNLKGLGDFFKGFTKDLIGTTAAEALQNYYRNAREGEGEGQVQKKANELGTKTNESEYFFQFTPVFNYDRDLRNTTNKTVKKSCGFTLIPDAYGDITVSVYRAALDKAWGDTSGQIRRALNIGEHNDSLLYSSYVFYTEAGATFCPYEDEMRTAFYNPGTLLGNATVPIAEPELTANTYEVTNVPADQPAYIRIEMKNNGQIGEGRLSDFRNFELGMVNASNADGLEVYADGNSLAAPIPVNILPGQTAYKTIKIMRGVVDDYKDLRLRLYVSSCPKNYSDMSFSVHFMPQSSPVSIASPKPNWVMNTLSPRDSTGFYLPVEIDGFDITKKNFDHIEFQYKLSSQSDEMWVNLCSFYAADSLYKKATGNKAMIENGRITPFRFYGEKDPVEQKYDLRAVSFCRYGSGFVSKSSPIISGVKDTRPPRVFGEPEPVNAILGVGDHLRLRFNEPIAGNYLDEDNNFQLRGATNATGITSNTSLHFDGSEKSYAASDVARSLKNTSFSIDLMVNPAAVGEPGVFFSHSDGQETMQFGITAERKLFFGIDDYVVYSKVTDPMRSFTRVVMAYDADQRTVHFYTGTKDMTDPVEMHLDEFVNYDVSAPLCFGKGFRGSILEARVWLKALTQEEVSATHLRRLTGYERELVAYYPMNEGHGTVAKDQANGANLILSGAAWNLPSGISMTIAKSDSVALVSHLIARSKIYDGTYMFWFRANGDGHLFSAGRTEATDTTAATGLRMALENGQLILYNDDQQSAIGNRQCADGAWHHIVLSVNRTYNSAALYLDGTLTNNLAASEIPAIAGDMYFGGQGFEGNIDELVVFEQALPKSLIEDYGNRSPAGDEMGLIAYLPFEEQIVNPNGVPELVFSVNDRRIFKDPNGKVVNKTVPLIDLSSLPGDKDRLADKVNYAPVQGNEPLSKLHFDWAFNNDELLINLNMLDREINKQQVYITVRDVEDMNGNPMPSPVTWTAFVDRNSLTWAEREMKLYAVYGAQNSASNTYEMKIINNSGKRHQYTIESLPEWLKTTPSYGSLQPTEDKTITFSYSVELPVGIYTDLVYLTDENGLAEPLRVELTIEAEAPYEEIDKGKYPLNMSLCGQVVLSTDGTNATPDSDPRDIVYAIYRNECIGMANIAFDAATNKSELYLTVYGNETMNKKALTFLLWQASTGKVFCLSPSEQIIFHPGNVYGCGDNEPVILAAGGSEVQQIPLKKGWNWTSFNIFLKADATGVINNVMTAEVPWVEGDQIKNPVTRNFCIYSEEQGAFLGGLYHFSYQYCHMVFSQKENTMRVSGNPLPADSMHVILRGETWSPLPCFYQRVTPIKEALADYYDHATPGDLIKAHDRFASFSQDRKWVGDLTALRPGEGYFFKRTGKGDVDVRFFDKPANAPTRKALPFREHSEAGFSNPKAATNMTMIATLNSEALNAEGTKRDAVAINVYIGSDLVGKAEPINPSLSSGAASPLYFLTIQSDKVGELRFETEDGTTLASPMPIRYEADAHHGSLQTPVILKPGENTLPYKIIEDDHVIIIRNNEKYDITGKKL